MEDYIKAHEFSSNNYGELKKSQKCGCFNCLEIFDSNEIKMWSENEGINALCPNCMVDSIIGEYSGYSIEKEFLKKMKDYWLSV